MWYLKSLIALGTLAVFAGLGQAHAQGVNGAQMVNSSGVVVALDLPNMQILVSDGMGGQVVLDFNSNRNVNGIGFNTLTPATSRVTGLVPRAALDRGLAVRVTGKVKRMREFVDPIAEMTITGVGIDQASSYGFSPATGLSISEEEEEQGIEGFAVWGLISRIRGTHFIITAPTGNGDTVSIEGELTEEAALMVDSADYRLASPGDQVNFGGTTFDGLNVFPMTATFTKRGPEPADAAGPEPAGPGPANGERQEPFGAGIPGAAGQEEDEPTAEADDAPRDDAPQADSAPPNDNAEQAPAATAEDPAEPESPGRALRIN